MLACFPALRHCCYPTTPAFRQQAITEIAHCCRAAPPSAAAATRARYTSDKHQQLQRNIADVLFRPSPLLQPNAEGLPTTEKEHCCRAAPPSVATAAQAHRTSNYRSTTILAHLFRSSLPFALATQRAVHTSNNKKQHKQHIATVLRRPPSPPPPVRTAPIISN